MPNSANRSCKNRMLKIHLSYAKFLLAALIKIALLLCNNHASADELRACVSEVAMPPFVITNEDKRVDGVAPQILRLAAKQLGFEQISLTALPFARCIGMSAAGQFDIVVNVPTAQIDPKPFVISKPFIRVNSQYFYYRSRFPSGLVIGSLADLTKFKVCALQGYNADVYGLTPSQVDAGAKSYDVLVKKLELGRCDLFIERREVLSGLYLYDPVLRGKLFGATIDHRDLPDDEGNFLHFAISRKSNKADKLKIGIDKFITEIKRTKKIDMLVNQFIQARS